MGHLIEISMVQDHRVFYERNSGSGERAYFTAYVQLLNNDQFIIDDAILPRLKQRLFQVLKAVPAPFVKTPLEPRYRYRN